MRPSASTLICGVGSPHGDDRIGWVICDELQSLAVGDTNVTKLKSPIELLNWLPEPSAARTSVGSLGPDRLIICDACCGLDQPGEIAHWTWPSNNFQSLRWSGTHDFSVPQVLSLAATLGRLPVQVDVWAIEKSERTSQSSEMPFLAHICDAVSKVADQIQLGLQLSASQE